MQSLCKTQKVRKIITNAPTSIDNLIYLSYNSISKQNYFRLPMNTPAANTAALPAAIPATPQPFMPPPLLDGAETSPLSVVVGVFRVVFASYGHTPFGCWCAGFP
nr:MAG TPA: hypothetical protein [Caudoviricetes sp.]